MFSTPRQSGPTNRIPAPRTTSSSRSSRSCGLIALVGHFARQYDERLRPLLRRLAGDIHDLTGGDSDHDELGHLLKPSDAMRDAD